MKYKEDFEKLKGQSNFVPGAELIHSKNISAVISEVQPQGHEPHVETTAQKNHMIIVCVTD